MLNHLKKHITNNLISDCIAILTHFDKKITLNHTTAVADRAAKLGRQFNLDSNKLVAAAYLHDISVVIPREQYAGICREYNIEIILLEEKLPILLHQKVSAKIAEKIFNINDEEILSAISCHTTLKSNPSTMDMALFIADKLNWDQEGIPPYSDVVESALGCCLSSACIVYIDYIIGNKMILVPHPDLISARKYLVQN